MRTGRLQVLFSIPKMAAVEAGKLKNGDCCRKCFPAFQKWSPLDVLLSSPEVIRAFGAASESTFDAGAAIPNVSCLKQRALVLQEGGMGKAFQHPMQKLTIDQAKKSTCFSQQSGPRGI